MNVRHFALLCVFVLIPRQASTAIPIRAVQSAPLELAVEDEAGPWSSRDGTGYTVDIVRAAFRASGISIHLQVVPYARCKQMAIEGEVAGCFSMSKAQGLEQSITYAELPLFVCQVDVIEAVSRPLHARTAGGMAANTRIGVVRAYEYPKALTELRDRGLLRFEEAPSEEVNLRKLADGRLDAVILNHDDIKSAEYMIADAGVTSKVRVAFNSGVLPSYVGFSRRHARARVAADSFNIGLRAITANGTLSRIRTAWLEKTREATRQLKQRKALNDTVKR